MPAGCEWSPKAIRRRWRRVSLARGPNKSPLLAERARGREQRASFAWPGAPEASSQASGAPATAASDPAARYSGAVLPFRSGRRGSSSVGFWRIETRSRRAQPDVSRGRSCAGLRRYIIRRGRANACARVRACVGLVGFLHSGFCSSV